MYNETCKNIITQDEVIFYSSSFLMLSTSVEYIHLIICNYPSFVPASSSESWKQSSAVVAALPLALSEKHEENNTEGLERTTSAFRNTGVLIIDMSRVCDIPVVVSLSSSQGKSTTSYQYRNVTLVTFMLEYTIRYCSTTGLPKT